MRRRNNFSFNLSFIDVMACGLGAIALILVLVKEDVLPSSFVDAEEIKQTFLEDSQILLP